MEIALIIPAHNEALSIEQTLLEFYQHKPDLSFYVIDNSSTDNTAQIAMETMQKHGIKGKVLYEARKGKGNAVRTAFRDVLADIFVMVDADCTYRAKDLEALLEPILKGKADIVIGDRHSLGDYKKHIDRPFHGFGNSLVAFTVNTLYRSKINDVMTGYRALSCRFVKNYPILYSGFELETEMTLHALDKHFPLVEVPVSYSARPEGSLSKLNTYKDGFRVIRSIALIFKDYNPLVYFGFLAGVFLLMSLGFGTPVLLEYIRTHWVTHVPLAILATGLAILALIFLSIGLILDTVAKNNRALYELRLVDFNKNGVKHV